MKKKYAPQVKKVPKSRSWKNKAILGVVIASVGLGALTLLPSRHVPSFLQKPKGLVEKQVATTQAQAHKMRLGLVPQRDVTTPRKVQKTKHGDKQTPKKAHASVAKQKSHKQKALTKKAKNTKSQKQLAAKSKGKHLTSSKAKKPSFAMQAR